MLTNPSLCMNLRSYFIPTPTSEDHFVLYNDERGKVLIDMESFPTRVHQVHSILLRSLRAMTSETDYILVYIGVLSGKSISPEHLHWSKYDIE